MSGDELISVERKRQLSAEGYSVEKDVAYYFDNTDLVDAAICYATPEEEREYFETLDIPMQWPWAAEYWKPTPEDRIRELVKAGALIAAEIDKLQALKK